MEAKEVLQLVMERERVARDCTQADIAKMLGVSDSTISNWESRNKPLRITDAERYLSALGLTTAEMFEEAFRLAMKAGAPKPIAEPTSRDRDRAVIDMNADPHFRWLVQQMNRAVEDLNAYLDRPSGENE